jgi:ribosomal protein S20
MPILNNAKKALRSSFRKAEMNRVLKSKVKTTRDAVTTAPGIKTLSTFFSSIDTAVKRNLLHRNKAARLKSQASKLVKV